MFVTVMCTTAKWWKQPKCQSTDECINKLWSTQIVEYYSAIKQEWNTDTWYINEPQKHYYK